MSTDSPSNSRISGWLCAVVLGVIVLQVFGRGGSSQREKPGPARGDLILTEEALPAKLAGWTRNGFVPAPPVDELPQGQYWWVHQWHYGKDSETAIASFDQLGEDRWHELTICYRILDWRIEDRAIHVEASTGGTYVVACMTKEDGRHGLLVFSVFFSDGVWDYPPDVGLSFVNGWTEGRPFLGRLGGRVQANPALPEDEVKVPRRALQCQVFLTSHSPLSEAQIASVVDLHLQSRNHFRSLWLASRNSRLATRN